MGLKAFFHCLGCKNFLSCKRKFEASDTPIYGSSTIVNDSVILNDILICRRPITKQPQKNRP